MYNIAITQDGITAFFADAVGKPRSYPTMADALVSAQYLGLTRKDVELHFVKEGTVIPESLTAPITGGTEDNPDKDPLAGMTKAQLLAYAGEHGLEIDKNAKVDDIREQIRAAEQASAQGNELETVDLSEMDHDQLLDFARELGLEVSPDMADEDITAAIRAIDTTTAGV
jgi:predicted component of type VI protein secretion system